MHDWGLHNRGRKFGAAVHRGRPGGADGERYRVLASSLLGKTMSPFVVCPTEKLADDPHPEHVGQGFMFVHVGSVELDYGDRTITLGAGDSAYFDASVSHKIRAIGDQRAEVLVVTTRDA